MRCFQITVALILAYPFGISLAQTQKGNVPARAMSPPIDEPCNNLQPPAGHEKLAQERQENVKEKCKNLLNRRLYEKAKSLAEETLRDEPDSAIFYGYRGVAEDGLGNLDAAIEFYTQAIDHGERDNGWVQCRRGRAYAAREDWTQAIADYTKAIEIDANDSSTYVGRSLAYQSAGDFPKARKDLETALRIGPDGPVLQEWIGYAYYKLGDEDKALECYTKAIRQGEKRVGALKARGNIYASRTDWTKAISDFTDVIAIEPANPINYISRAKAYIGSGDVTKARKDLETALQAGPDGPELEEWLGYAYDRLGDHEKAFECYTKAIQQGDNRWLALEARGHIYASRQDWIKAIRDYTNAITIQPGNSYACVERAIAYNGTGELSKAREDLKSISAKDKERPELQENLGEAYRGLGENDRALRFFTKAIENGNNQAWILNRRGCIYANRQIWGPAIADFTAAIRLTPAQTEAYHYRGNCYLARCQYAEARSDFEQVCMQGGADGADYLLADLLARLSAAGCLAAGPAKPNPSSRLPVIFPADKQKKVPTFFSRAGETPDPIPHPNIKPTLEPNVAPAIVPSTATYGDPLTAAIAFDTYPYAKEKLAGYPITITFNDDCFVEAVQAKLTDADGHELPCWVSSPQEPANDEYARYQGNTVCLIAKTQLQPRSKYTVLVSARVNGEPWNREWSFTTDPDETESLWETDDQRHFAEWILEAVNKERAAAGLNKVVLDDALSRGCFKHARYLATNAGRPELEGLKAHNEDDKLPDATKEGRKAGLHAVIVGGCNPGICVPVWMSTLYHRVPILDPKLKRIGIGFVRFGKSKMDWVNVMDVGNGKD